MHADQAAGALQILRTTHAALVKMTKAAEDQLKALRDQRSNMQAAQAVSPTDERHRAIDAETTKITNKAAEVQRLKTQLTNNEQRQAQHAQATASSSRG